MGSDSQRREISEDPGSPPSLSPQNTFDLCFDLFAYPLARLIRRMRRCEIMLLPLVGEWTLVDVVLTGHELVLFDVIENERSSSQSSALSSKNGGKGQYLHEVAKGRKIVSQFSLEEVDFINIEHRPVLRQACKSNASDVEDM